MPLRQPAIGDAVGKPAAVVDDRQPDRLVGLVQPDLDRRAVGIDEIADASSRRAEEVVAVGTLESQPQRFFQGASEDCQGLHVTGTFTAAMPMFGSW